MVKVAVPSGRLVDIVPVDFSEDASPWSTVSLEDGTVLKIKVTPTAIARYQDEFDQAGNPVYYVSTQIIVRVVKAKLRGEPTVGPAAVQPGQQKRDPSVG